jgi:hypothetical protein
LQEIIITTKWNEYLNYLQEQNRDIYFTEEYVKLYENNENRAECFVYKDGEKLLLFPYLKRRIVFMDADYFDFETAYGYGGPVSNTTDVAFINKALDAFEHSAKDTKLVAGLVRFHPLLENHSIFNNRYDVIFDRNTVALNLNLDNDTIWKDQIHPKHRNVIIKANKLGLIYKADEELQYLEIFQKIYISTMNKVATDTFYFFNDSYFTNIKRFLKDSAFLGFVLLDDKIMAGALFFKYGYFGHYHLAGSLEDYKQYYPNNFLIYKTALYMKEKGIQLFHLGGGTNGNTDNTLYKFKKRFSKDLYSFYIGKMIFNEKIYTDICSIWADKYPEKKEQYGNFILKYRY